MSTESTQRDAATTGSGHEPLVAPELILDAKMLRSWYVPADPEAAAALLPARLDPLPNHQAFLNQYAVETDEQTAALGAFAVSYAGFNVQGHDVGGFPAHWLGEYLNSNGRMRDYTADRGFPVSEGQTRVTQDGDLVTATTEVDGRPVIRTVARVGERTATVRGRLGYVTRIGDDLVLARYPFVAEVADPFEIQSIEFLDPSHPIYALRPAQPLDIVFALYSPRISFCYPQGGEERL